MLLRQRVWVSTRNNDTELTREDRAEFPLDHLGLVRSGLCYEVCRRSALAIRTIVIALLPMSSYRLANGHTPALPRPMEARSASCSAGSRTEVHSHARAQLLYSRSGFMKVTAGNVSWVLPPQRAIWLPAGTKHSAVALSALQLRTLYIEPSAIPFTQPSGLLILQISPLLRELISRVAQFSLAYDEMGHDGQLLRVLFGELDWTASHAPSLPPLTDPRLLLLERLLSRKPGDDRTLNQWANTVGATTRTLTRLLLKEAGMTFRTWREHLRVAQALTMLAESHSVTEVAMELGYDSPSAFTVMFRRVTGQSPSEYMKALR